MSRQRTLQALLVLVLLSAGCSDPAPVPPHSESEGRYLVHAVDGVLEVQPRSGVATFHRLPEELLLRADLVVDNVQLDDGTAWLICSAVRKTSAYRLVRGGWRVFDVPRQLRIRRKGPDRVYAEDTGGQLWWGSPKLGSSSREPRWVWTRLVGSIPEPLQEETGAGVGATALWNIESLRSTPRSTFVLESSKADKGRYRISRVAAGEDASSRQPFLRFPLPFQSSGIGILGLSQVGGDNWSVLLGIDTSAELGRLTATVVYSPDSGASWRDVGGEEWAQRMVMTVEQTLPFWPPDS